MKKQPLLIEGKKPTMRSLLLFLEGLEHSFVTLMISAARIGQRNEELVARIETLEKLAKKKRRK